MARRPRSEPEVEFPARVETISPALWKALLAGEIELVSESPGPPGFAVLDLRRKS